MGHNKLGGEKLYQKEEAMNLGRKKIRGALSSGFRHPSILVKSGRSEGGFSFFPEEESSAGFDAIIKGR